MGRLLLVCRLAARDLQRRPGEAVMLLIALTAALTALTLGLVLRGVTSQPYQTTREATVGPDVLATAFPGRSGPPADHAGLADVAPLTHAPGVVGHSGPFPVASPFSGHMVTPMRCWRWAAAPHLPRWTSPS